MERSVSKLIAVTIAVWIGLIMAALIAGAVFAALACAIAWGLAQFFWLAVQRLRRPAEQTDGFAVAANDVLHPQIAQRHAMLRDAVSVNDNGELRAARRIH
jgi:hypothetical protein